VLVMAHVQKSFHRFTIFSLATERTIHEKL
jgi:hypothetical protein